MSTEGEIMKKLAGALDEVSAALRKYAELLDVQEKSQIELNDVVRKFNHNIE